MNSTKKCSGTHYINYNTALTNHPYTTAQVIYVRDALVIKWKKIQFKIIFRHEQKLIIKIKEKCSDTS